GYDSEIGNPTSLLLCEPVEVADGFVVDGGRELDLDAHGATVVTFDDEIDFVFAAISAQVARASFDGLSAHAHGQRGQAFEQRAQRGGPASEQRPTLPVQ